MKKGEKIKLKKRYLFCLIAILVVFPLVSLLQSTTRAGAALPVENGISNVEVTQGDSLCKQKPSVFDGSSDLPGSFVLANHADDLSPSEILKLQSSCAGESILEYTLTLSCDNQSYETIPLCKITPIQPNGSIIALVGNDPKNGDFMWLQEYNGVFPSLSQSEAFEVLDSNGYSAQNDSRLVFFDSEMYWMFNVTIGESVMNVFVSFSDQQIKLAADMLSRLTVLQSDDSGMLRESYPSSYTWMVGKVPYFMQGSLPWCGIFSQKQVLWWYGIKVSEYDIANYLGVGTDEGITLEQNDQAFVHFMGFDNENSLQHSYGSSDIETEKSWLYAGSPQIEAIRAPGTGEGNDVNHAVTLVGWDDDLGGGSWCLHDTAPWITAPDGTGYDVWISYSNFDEYWDKYWYSWIIGGYTRGSVGAIPGDGQYPSPSVAINGLTDIQDNQQLTFTVSLSNTEEDASTATDESQGAFVKFDNAEIVSVDVRSQFGWFKSFKTFDEQGNEIPMAGAKIIEFYTSQLTWWYRVIYGITTVSAGVTIRPTGVGSLTVYYRGWLQDTADRVRQHWTTIDDSRPGLLATMLAEPYIARDPYCSWSTMPSFLDYPTYSQTCTVTDDDTQGPTFLYPSSSEIIYDSYSGDYVLDIEVTDPSGLSAAGAQFSYRFGDSPNWSEYKPYTYLGELTPSITIFEYCIPRTEWINHVGYSVYFKVYAEDNDNDWAPYWGYVYTGKGWKYTLIKDSTSATSNIITAGSILDDDTTGPSLSNPSLELDPITKNLRMQIDATDPSGVQTVWFSYRFDSGSTGNVLCTGSSGNTYWCDIPYAIWSPHSGQTIYWAAYATDADNDYLGDGATSQSLEYSTTIICGVDISINPSTAIVQPGSSTSFIINVHNTGNMQDTYTLTANGLNPTWYTFSQTSITISAGQTVQVTLTISPPHTSMILEDYPFIVIATNQEDPTISDSANGIVTVDFTPTLPLMPTGGLAIAIQPKTIYMSPTSELVVNIYVINNQNFDDVITIDITNSGTPAQYQANLAWFNWTQVRVFIPAGSSIKIPLKITVPASTPIGMYVFKAVATSTAKPTTTAKDSGIIKIQSPP
jgi:hypothetical protein